MSPTADARERAVVRGLDILDTLSPQGLRDLGAALMYLAEARAAETVGCTRTTQTGRMLAAVPGGAA